MFNKVKGYFSKSTKETAYIPTNQDFLNDRINEAISISQVSTLINSSAYLPFTNASLNYTSLAVLMNDIVINNRKFIVEFGCGISTIAMATLIRKNKLENVRILSIEDNFEWMQVVIKLLKAEELSEYVDLLYAPLIDNNFSLDGNKWYDSKIIKDKLLKTNLKVDCVLVDGPPAWYSAVYRSRFPALPFLYQFLNESSVVFLDDTNRKGEREIINLWSEFNLQRVDFSNYFTGLFKGHSFNISLP